MMMRERERASERQAAEIVYISYAQNRSMCIICTSKKPTAATTTTKIVTHLFTYQMHATAPSALPLSPSLSLFSMLLAFFLDFKIHSLSPSPLFSFRLYLVHTLYFSIFVGLTFLRSLILTTHAHIRTFLAVSFRRIILCIFFIWWCVRSLFSSAL